MMLIKLNRGRLSLFLLILAFFLPVLAAWYMVFFTDFGRQNDGSVAHGVLIQPPRQLSNLHLHHAKLSTAKFNLHGQWSMLVFQHSKCETACWDRLYKMRQIRLAMGRRMGQVQKVIVLTNNTEINFVDQLAEDYPQQLYILGSKIGYDFMQPFEDQDIFNSNPLFLIDTAGFLMMRYSEDVNPSGIIKDLNRLLRISGQDL